MDALQSRTIAKGWLLKAGILDFAGWRNHYARGDVPLGSIVAPAREVEAADEVGYGCVPDSINGLAVAQAQDL